MVDAPCAALSVLQIAARGNAAALTLWAGVALAAPAPIPLAPPQAQIGYTVYAFGLLPVDASFGAFRGDLRITPAAAQPCAVRVKVRVASLRMADPGRRAQALGPAMLDAARFPEMVFDGACQDAGHLAGMLTMHGVTRPLAFNVRRTGQRLEASAMLRRRDWGVAGLPNLVGGRVRIRLVVMLPADVLGGQSGAPAPGRNGPMPTALAPANERISHGQQDGGTE